MIIPGPKPGIWSMVRVPAIITLCVSMLRLAGELLGWNETFFGTAAGGGGAVVGISWLVVFFGFWFGRRIRIEEGGPGAYRILTMTLIAIAVTAGGIYGLTEAGWIVMPDQGPPAKGPEGMRYFYGMVGVGAVISMFSWPRLGMTLLLYGLLARIPVAIITFFSVVRNWDTHYVKPPPGVPPQEGMSLILSLCEPQFTFWIGFTIVVGVLFGAFGAATSGKSAD